VTEGRRALITGISGQRQPRRDRTPEVPGTGTAAAVAKRFVDGLSRVADL
jgi:hypothetical protein